MKVVALHYMVTMYWWPFAVGLSTLTMGNLPRTTPNMVVYPSYGASVGWQVQWRQQGGICTSAMVAFHDIHSFQLYSPIDLNSKLDNITNDLQPPNKTNKLNPVPLAFCE